MPIGGLTATAGLSAQTILASNNPGYAPVSPNVLFVDSVSALPAPIGGIINLAANTAYWFAQTVDLLGSRLSCGSNTVILGSSSENCRILSTGLVGQPLISSVHTLPIQNIALEAQIVFSLISASPANALDWFGVNIVNSPSIGTISGYSNVVFGTCAFLNSGGLVFDGTIGSVVATSTLFDAAPGTTVLTFPPSLTITRRVRLSSCPFIVLPGETGINFSTSAVIPNESYILENPNFAGGGTYTAGVTFSDNKAAWGPGVGVPASSSVGNMTMVTNATATVIGSAGVFVKAAGVTTAGTITQRFSHTTNRLTYIGSSTRNYAVEAIVSLTSGVNNVVSIAVYRNGVQVSGSVSSVTTSGTGRSENITCQCVITMATNDYVEIWVSNGTGANNITVSDLNVLIRAI